MLQLKSFSALTTTLVLLAGIAIADMKNNNMQDHSMHEKCKVMDKNGKNIVKQDMADGFGDNDMMMDNSSNNRNDAWVWVPQGWCVKVNEWVAKDQWKNAPADVKKALDNKLMM